MNISKKMQDAINTQVKHEIYSAYLYLSMSLWCDTQNRPGAASWLKLQWQEELAHADRFMAFVNRRGGTATLDAINKPPSDFGSLLQLFEQVLEHEQSVTAKISKLYEMAQSEKDYATEAELQWFITEQVEEEESAMQIIELLKQVGDHGPSLMMLDRQLGERTAGGTAE